MFMQTPSAVLIPPRELGEVQASDLLSDPCLPSVKQSHIKLYLFETCFILLHMKLVERGLCDQEMEAKRRNILQPNYAFLCHCSPNLASRDNELFFTTHQNKHFCFFLESMCYICM